MSEGWGEKGLRAHAPCSPRKKKEKKLRCFMLASNVAEWSGERRIKQLVSGRVRDERGAKNSDLAFFLAHFPYPSLVFLLLLWIGREVSGKKRELT